MFGQNRITGRKFFADSSGRLLVTSIFSTIQGEGPYAGMPAVFVRLAMCNLACSFCDTYFDRGDWFTVDELSARIRVEMERAGTTQKIVVITGGEPLLQPALPDLLTEVNRNLLPTQIESNGILDADIPPDTTLVVSPKCLESKDGPVRYFSVNKETLERANCLKFVVSAEEDSPYHDVPEWALNWRNEWGRPVFISPMNVYNHEPGQASDIYVESGSASLEERTIAEKVSFWEPGLLDLEQCRANHEYAAVYCMKHGLRLSIQQHLFASLP